MANSMKSADVIQEVKILPRVTASHRPGSGTRWQEETNVRSRGKQVGRPCIEPRNRIYFVVQDARPRTGKGINSKRTPESGRCEPRTVSTGWNATSKATPTARRQGGHRGRRPEHADQGMTRELVRASSSPVFESAEHQQSDPLRESTAIPKLPPERPPPQGRSSPKMRRTQVRRNEPESEGASDGR